MNYIKHLNMCFEKFQEDTRLNPTHISLYMALFHFWNIYKFPETFYINRHEVMKLSKIGSKATYHRCLKKLSDWKFINYMPSHNPYKGSEIKILILGTTSKQVINKLKTSTEQALVPNTNSNKQIENIIKQKLPKNKIEVIHFFKSKNWSELEAQKFYNHYQSIGWKIGGKIKIVDWQASAGNWVLKTDKIKTENALSQNKDNLKTSKIKNYDQPL
ncbi:hypothetical protein ACFFU1_11455 [Algibacter miyuki]|uniref:Transcriptional regulator n=1 Tax=Algibacter miyuki TaxID=1306933 RepID=A0ABV5H1F0_9FLAO|nr:hypothetical protein [Algibacter miyuki]MDN3664085.1 hypothetical protein [Algibacter miyuki]